MTQMIIISFQEKHWNYIYRLVLDAIARSMTTKLLFMDMAHWNFLHWITRYGFKQMMLTLLVQNQCRSMMRKMTLFPNFQIVAHLDSLGFVQLLALHLKLLCGDELLDTAKKEKFGNEVSNVLFQITSCLRNMMNIRKSKDMFVHINGKNKHC